MSKYRHWHDQIIDRARARKLKLEGGERHHIIPRSLKGTDDKSNVVLLTYREHYLVHWILTKITPMPQKLKMLHALHQMAFGRDDRPVTSWQYALARKASRAAMLGNTRGAGRVVLEKERREHSRRMLGNKNGVGVNRKGIKLFITPEGFEARRQFGNLHAKGNKNGPLSVEHRANLIASLRVGQNIRRLREDNQTGRRLRFIPAYKFGAGSLEGLLC